MLLLQVLLLLQLEKVPFIYLKKYILVKKSIEDLDWVKNVMESKLSSKFVENVTTIAETISKSGNTKDIGKLISSLLSTMFTTKA